MITRVMRVSVIACMVVAILLLGGGAFAASGPNLRRIVVFRDGTSQQVQQQAVAKSGSRLLHVLSLVNGAAIELPAVNTGAALAYLQAHPAVAAVYDDPVIGAHGEVSAIAQGAGGDGAGGDQGAFVTPVPAPNTKVYPWGIWRIGAAYVQGAKPPVAGDGVKVAIFDTGIDRTHPNLAPNIDGGFNAIADADPKNYQDDNGHGTAIAGIIAADPRMIRFGVIGAAPHATLYAVKVLDSTGRGHTSDVIHALGVISSRQDIRLINMSFGTSINWPLFPMAVQRTIQSGKIIVASRGNASVDCTDASAQGAGGDGAGGDASSASTNCFAVRYPAAYPDVITVGATTLDVVGKTIEDDVASYSLWGVLPDVWQLQACLAAPPLACWRPKVDVVAPGGAYPAITWTQQIFTTNLGGGYGVMSGTSPAAAHVTGAVALALQLRRHLSAAQVQELLNRTATYLDCCQAAQEGAGLIDVRAMVEQLKKWPAENDGDYDQAHDKK